MYTDPGVRKMSQQDKKLKMTAKKNSLAVVGIFLGFWSLFFVFYKLAPYIHEAMSNIIVVRAEYTVYEQLSKYFLFVVILASIHSYGLQSESIKIKISICFLLLGLSMYLSESNMIKEAVQVIIGFIIFAYTFFLLFKSRSWFVALLLLQGLFVTSLAVLTDFMSEHEFLKNYLTQQVANVLISNEEIFDLLGIGIICFSAIICFLDTLKTFIKNNLIGTLSLLITSGLITGGNGFLHYQYWPSGKLRLVAIMMTVSGFLGLVLTNRYLNKKNARLTLIDREYFFYLFIFSIFVVLPIIYGRNGSLVSLVVWLPTMLFLGLYLYYHNLLRNNNNVESHLLLKWTNDST